MKVFFFFFFFLFLIDGHFLPKVLEILSIKYLKENLELLLFCLVHFWNCSCHWTSLYFLIAATFKSDHFYSSHTGNF